MKIKSLVSIFVLISTLFLSSFAQAPDPNSLLIAGLKDSVIVQRDERAIPYIEAKNEHDLYFAQGYVTASDRLWQMDVLRRTARGEMSEIFGKVVLEEDKRRRRYGFAALSEKSAAMLSPQSRTALDSFVKGVNAFIASRDEKTLPREFKILSYKPRPWTASDTIVIGYLMAESLSSTWTTDVMRATFAHLPKEMRDELLTEFTPLDTPVVGSDKKSAAVKKAVASVVRVSSELAALAQLDDANKQSSLDRIGFGAEDLAASNNWVVSGKKTASKKPLLSNDPHLAPAVPGIWYLSHLSAPGVRVSGVTIPGLNGIIIGHNDRIAWGMTNVGPDVQDLYKETFDTTNPLKYKTPTGWKDADIRREEIKVRKVATKPETESVMMDVVITRHGPIVIEKEGERYALQWTIFDPKRESVSVFYNVNRAQNFMQFTAALKGYAGAMQNNIYADVDGNIGYYAAGYIPIRKTGDGSVPYDGATDEGEWTSFVPWEKLPRSYNPPSGMIVTANSRVVGRDYPYHLTHSWSAPYRQKRINDLLGSKNKITIEDFRATLGDTFAIGGSTFAKAVAKLAGNKADGKFAESVKLLAEWDGNVKADSRGALLVHEMREVFSNKIFAAALGDELSKQYRWTNKHFLLDRIVTEWPAKWLPKNSANWLEFVKVCEAESRENLTKKFGADESKWTFGNAVQVKFNHPLAAAPMIGGQFKIDAFGQNGNGYAGGLGPTVNVGPTVSMRMIIDLSNLDNSQHGIPLGQSGDAANSHYKDQLEDWRNVTPKTFPFSKAAVNKAAQSTMILMPK